MENLNRHMAALSNAPDAKNLYNALEGVYRKLSTQLLTSGALVAGTINTNVKLAAAITYSINGKLYQKAITDNFWTPAVATTAANNFNVSFLYIDSAGAASSYNGKEGTSINLIAVPPTQKDKALVGIVIVTNAAGAFTTSSPLTTGTTFINTVGMFDPTALI